MLQAELFEQGCAVVMQGHCITHQALRALGAQERITMVTSFWPKSPLLPDDSNLRTVRGISEISELYYQYGRYRLEILEARMRDQIRRLDDAHSAGKKTDTKALKRFLDEQERFLQHMNMEMVPDDQVVQGHQPDLGIPNATSQSPEEKTSVVEKACL